MAGLSGIFRSSPSRQNLSIETKAKAVETAKYIKSAIKQLKNSGGVVRTPARSALADLERNVDKLLSRAEGKNFSLRTAIRNVEKIENHAVKLRANMHDLFKGPIPQSLQKIRSLGNEIRSHVDRRSLAD
ncbi:hypothetical protein [Burkholderia lata]|uniref:hypothetical protein n=1 Tax=Burkholderia lata (strain ATCC 17760 / DSM 23089 / LMG 22485 / NCIMB 9086 / R18194 / 383) TaxID=482957 RepID=UPI003999DC53